MIRAVYACRWQRQITWDACSVFNVAHNQTAYSNSKFVARNVHNHFSNQQMKRVQLGNSDLQVSVACIGTMLPSTQGTEHSLSSTEPEVSVGKGGNFIDTAEMYPVPSRPEYVGKSEEIVGNWLAARSCRDDFIIATKVTGPTGSSTASANRTVPPDPDASPALTPAAIRAAVDGSLRRLQTDRIDLYQLHWPARYVPLFGMKQFRPEQARDAASFEDLVEAVGELITAGKVRHWGLSNETAYGVTMMCETAKRLGVPLPVTIQNDYSLCDRYFDLDVAEACHVYGVKLIPYGVLAGGFLSGKYRGGAQPEGARHTVIPQFQPRYATPAVGDAVEKYAALADSKGLSLTQLAVAWAASRWHIGAIITGQTRVDQMDEYLDAIELPLDQATLKAVDKIHMQCRNPEWKD